MLTLLHLNRFSAHLMQAPDENDSPSRSLIERQLNAHTAGMGQRDMVFVHDYGCDQNMWRLCQTNVAADLTCC